MSDSIPQWAQAAIEQKQQRLSEIERQLSRELTREQYAMVVEIIDQFPAAADPWREHYEATIETVARHFGEMGAAIRAVYFHVVDNDGGSKPEECGLGLRHDEEHQWLACRGAEPVARKARKA